MQALSLGFDQPLQLGQHIGIFLDGPADILKLVHCDPKRKVIAYRLRDDPEDVDWLEKLRKRKDCRFGETGAGIIAVGISSVVGS